MSTLITLDLPYDLLQSIRLAHAIMETSYDVLIAPEHEIKFSLLKAEFGVRYQVGDGQASALPGLAISHPEPRTAIGSIDRPLIFAKAIAEKCRTMWGSNRDKKYVFAGLVTDSRKTFFREFLKSSHPSARFNVDDLGQRTFSDKVQSKLSNALGIRPEPKARKKQFGDLALWESHRGRSFPYKSWDEDYFRLMAQAQFVLCPSGDYVWSYRFFEACMCGAMPIIEEECPAYEGFRWLSVDAIRDTMKWTEADALHNFEMCVQRLTIPKDELEREIARLLTTG
jgi:hypothetical protein